MGLVRKVLNVRAAREKLEPLTVYAPVKGEILPLSEVGDGVFSAGILGPGCGIVPEDETVYAPFHGTVVQVAGTRHAVGLTSEDGMEVLIHVGLDTVDMNGRGFRVFVKEGQKVNKGDPLLTFSKKAIREAGHPATTMVIVTNAGDGARLSLCAAGRADSGEKLMKWENVQGGMENGENI